MDARSIIFVAIVSLLAVALYSSSISVSNATIACAKSKDGKSAICTDSVKETFYKCTKDKKGTWSCEDITAKEAGSTNVPSALSQAIVKAQAGAIEGSATTGENKTHMTYGNTSKSGQDLKGDESRNSPTNNTDILQ